MNRDKEVVTATPNQSKRTFTIRVQQGDYRAKYRTFPTSRQEFEDDEMSTPNDWKYFLRSCDGSYYKV